jgi:hypothetical protein
VSHYSLLIAAAAPGAEEARKGPCCTDNDNHAVLP